MWEAKKVELDTFGSTKLALVGNFKSAEVRTFGSTKLPLPRKLQIGGGPPLWVTFGFAKNVVNVAFDIDASTNVALTWGPNR